MIPSRYAFHLLLSRQHAVNNGMNIRGNVMTVLLAVRTRPTIYTQGSMFTYFSLTLLFRGVGLETSRTLGNTESLNTR